MVGVHIVEDPAAAVAGIAHNNVATSSLDFIKHKEVKEAMSVIFTT
jgi:hypothetical protein